MSVLQRMAKSLCTISDASNWVWNNLWKRDSPQAHFDMVDVLKIVDGKIDGWLFTSSDGLIKQRTSSKWTLSYLDRKCRSFNGITRAHIFCSNEWRHLENIESKFQIPPLTDFIVPLADMYCNPFYVEVNFEKRQGIAAPKVTTYRLVDSSVKGRDFLNEEMDENILFPTQKISFKHKKMNETIKEKMNKLVSTLEQRSRSYIDRLICVFLIEDVAGGSCSLRLHHCKQVDVKLSKTKLRKKIQNNGHSDTHSMISEVTNVSRGSSWMSKCCGDFCGFNEAFESSLADMEEELNFRIDVEASKARRRHRNVDGDADTSVNDDIEAGVRLQKDVVESAVNSNTMVDLSSTQSYKVSQKSIMLARNEMKLLVATDSYTPEVTAWSRTLQAWYRRTGHASIGKRVTPIPASSGHHIDMAMLQIAEHGSVVDKSYVEDASHSEEKYLGSPKLTKRTLENMTCDNANFPLKAPSSTHIGSLPYDLQHKPFHEGQNSSSKHLGRYYSSCSVCEKCYHVYKDLDRMRRSGFKQELQQKKTISENANQHAKHYDDIERVNRISNQIIHTSRLAKAKVCMDSRKNSSPHPDSSSFLSQEGAPKGVLPPLPWHLNKAELVNEYKKQCGSSFVRKIGSKAQQAILLAEQENLSYSQQSFSDSTMLSSDFDWRKNLGGQFGMVKSSSAGSVSKLSAKMTSKEITRNFNSERLLHPHQRSLEMMKRDQCSDSAVLTGVRIKGGSKRKMLSRNHKKMYSKLPPVLASKADAASSFKRVPDALTYSYVEEKLQYPSPNVGVSKNVSFAECNSVRNIPSRLEEEEEEQEQEEESDDEIGMKM